MFHGDGKREYVHKVYKVKVTEDYLTEDSQLKRRGKDQCPTNYALCAASLGGDCCPNNYSCAKDSCYATTAAVSTCAGQASYYACPFDVGGGCCPQGLVCGAGQACNPPAGATYSQTCGTGYTLCPSSVNYGCCQSGMVCGSSACFNLSPSTSVTVFTTTQDGSATTVTSTSVFTPTADSSGTADGAVAKIYPSTYPKQAATEGDDSSGGGASSGLSKGAIGGIVGGAAALLLIFLAVAIFIVKRLKRTERAVQSRRETTSGSGTRQTTEKKSATQVSITRIQPTPSEVDALDCDPLMMSSSVASPRGQQQHLQGNGRSRSGSDAPSQPSGYSSSAAGLRWNTPSVDSDGGDSNSREYFTLPPRVHNQPGGRDGRRISEASSQYSYHHFAYARHGRNYSNASELSAGSDEVGSQRGIGSPLMGPTTAELSSDGGFVPELPGSDTETESNGPHGANGRRPPHQSRKRSTSVVSPMSTTAVNKPPLTHANLARRRGSSSVSPMDAQNGSGGRGRSDSSVAPDQRLGSIDESATTSAPTTNSMHGYFGSPTTAVGQTAVGTKANFSSPPLPGFVSLGPPQGNQTEESHGDERFDEKQYQ
ncbi:hypothetical protein J7T55_006188 [Diaporthe amygdali]|uniref:uncharacterized protein n=1 Tax=Phomopsis amygdali TaxID=1214568 RepID=UPI0022FF3E78|nr:uncharacterized protein J7T55_006188 [Diaporthe amygdali]KAJ0124845.1 hypothetical protein J7T55_006188 [Diaporthe amygdali]